jgi:hypothetical protein
MPATPPPPPPPATTWLAIPGETAPREVLVTQVAEWAKGHPQLQVLAADRKSWVPAATYLAVSSTPAPMEPSTMQAVSPFETASEAGLGTSGAGDEPDAVRARYQLLTEMFVDNPDSLSPEEHAELIELQNQVDGLE